MVKDEKRVYDHVKFSDEPVIPKGFCFQLDLPCEQRSQNSSEEVSVTAYPIKPGFGKGNMVNEHGLTVNKMPEPDLISVQS